MSMKKKKIKKSQIVLNLILIIMCITTLYPLLLCLGVSFSNEQDVLQYGYSLIPKHFDLTGYKYVFTNPKTVVDAYKVTIIFSVVATLGMLICNSLMAYPLSRQ